MPKKDAPEFSYNEKTGMYRKQIKNPCNGKWISVYGKTRAEIRRNIQERTAELEAAAQAGDNPFVYQYAAEWYRLKTVDLGQKRKDDYRNAINNHICPIIGTMRVVDVTPADIDRVMAQLAGKSKSLQQKVTTVLRRVFKYAVKNKLITESPCEDLTAGGKDAAEKVPLTREQQCRLCAAVKGTRADLIVALALYAGLRREEILGLQWDAVHLDDPVPHLSVIRATRWDGKNQPIVSEVLKSDASRRDIPLPPQLVTKLHEAKETAKGAFVVCDSKGGPMSSTSFRKAWDAIRVRSVRDGLQLGDKIPKHNIIVSLDFRVTPHQLRHTYITELILAGANIKTVQYLAGHKSVQLTLDIYTHLLDNRPCDTAPAVLQAFQAKNQVKSTPENAQSIDNQGLSDNRPDTFRYRRLPPLAASR